MLKSANDKGSVQFQIARTYAAGGQFRDAMDWLRKVVDSNLGFDPSRDQLFSRLNASKEFQQLLDTVRAQTPPISNSRLAANIPDSDLFPENLAHDAVANTFYLGSTTKDEILRCNQSSICTPFVPPHGHGLGSVLGLKVHGASRTLWATSNIESGAGLNHYDLATGRLIRAYSLAGAHLFNDLAISSDGRVFVTDTREGAVYEILNDNSELKRLIPNRTFTAANGIALSPDQTILYISDFGDGITAVDLASQRTTPVRHPASIGLGYIDGLYALNGALMAIQNGSMVPRIVRFGLSPDGHAIVSINVLERRNPLFDGITTGVLSGNRFYYVANSQLDKISNGKIKPGIKLDPLHILEIAIPEQNPSGSSR